MKSKLGLSLMLAGVLCTPPVFAEDSTIGTSSVQVENSAPAFRPYDFKGNWKMDVGGGNAQEGKDTWSAGYLWIDSNIDFKLLEPLSIHIEPMARLYGGRAQERYDEDTLDSRVGVLDARVSYQPLSILELNGGILSQRIVGNSMLVSRWKAFSGFQQIVKGKLGEFEGRVILQQVIPNSHSLNDEREKQEALPWFRTEQVELSGKHFRWLEWKTKAGLYEWNDIPSKVVFESVRQGNAPGSTPTPAGSRFAYGHQGWFGGAEVCYCDTSPVNFVADFDRIHNLRAPGDSADAQRWGFGPKIKWKDHSFDFRYRNYFIESDATVAAYNSSRIGGTNRIGEAIDMNLHFEKARFSLYGQMYKARPINNLGTPQRDMEQYYFGLETDYANF